jgi:hypothetical protein
MSVIERNQKWWETTSAVVLLIVAGLGIIYDVLHRFGTREFVHSLASPEEVLILLVALLCGGLGAERLLTLRKIEVSIKEANKQRSNILATVNRISDKLGKLQRTVKEELQDVGETEGNLISAVNKINKAESLIGTKAVEDAARKLIEDCSDSDKIRATGQYRPDDQLSKQYFMTIANKVKRAKQNQGDMQYQVIMPARSGSDRESLDERRRVFKEEGIEDRLIIRYAKHPWPFEVLIGGRSMIIALLGAGEKPPYEVAIKITDSEFVEKVSEWFREVAWGEEANRGS